MTGKEKKYKLSDRIKDAFVLLFYRCFSFFPVPKRMLHLQRNMEAWEKYRLSQSEQEKGGYIERQKELSGFAYGTRYLADYNSCEVIAVYNALHFLQKNSGISESEMIFSEEKGMHREMDFPQLLCFFEKRGITCGGAFGTSPYALLRFFCLLGYWVTSCRFGEWNRLCDTDTVEKFAEENDAFLFMAYNDARSIRAMIHTMCITKENGGYVRHNDFSEPKRFPALKDAVGEYRNGKSRMILMLGIRRS